MTALRMFVAGWGPVLYCQLLKSVAQGGGHSFTVGSNPFLSRGRTRLRSRRHGLPTIDMSHIVTGLAAKYQIRYSVVMRGSVLGLADPSSLLHADHSPLRSSQMLVDTALERAEAELSNAVSTTAWKTHTGEWLAFRSELDAAGLSTGPLTYYNTAGTVS